MKICESILKPLPKSLEKNAAFYKALMKLQSQFAALLNANSTASQQNGCVQGLICRCKIQLLFLTPNSTATEIIKRKQLRISYSFLLLPQSEQDLSAPFCRERCLQPRPYTLWRSTHPLKNKKVYVDILTQNVSLTFYNLTIHQYEGS